MNTGHQALARARSLVTIHRWREAMDVLAPALAAEATAGEAHCLRAQCLLGLGEPGQAAGAARQALAVRPDSEWAHRLLGIAYLRMGRRRAAHNEAAEAVRLAPQSAHALHLMAMCQLALRKRAAAKRTARAAVAANPQQALAHLTLAKVAARGRDHETAERAYREGLRLEPDDPELSLGLAELMHRLGRRDEAAAAYLAAGRADPTDTRARRGLARLGLPAAGAGTFGLIKLLALVGVLRSLSVPGVGRALDSARPVTVGFVLGAGLLLAGAITTVLRVRGTRRLPAPVRQGLRGDHRNAVLRWLRIAAVAALVLALWAAALPGSRGGGPGVALGFAAFAVVAAYGVGRFWTGPRRSVAGVARAFASRFSPRHRC